MFIFWGVELVLPKLLGEDIWAAVMLCERGVLCVVLCEREKRERMD